MAIKKYNLDKINSFNLKKVTDILGLITTIGFCVLVIWSMLR